MWSGTTGNKKKHIQGGRLRQQLQLLRMATATAHGNNDTPTAAALLIETPYPTDYEIKTCRFYFCSIFPIIIARTTGELKKDSDYLFVSPLP